MFVFSAKLNYIKGPINKYRGRICVGRYRHGLSPTSLAPIQRIKFIPAVCEKNQARQLSVIILHSGVKKN